MTEKCKTCRYVTAEKSRYPCSDCSADGYQKDLWEPKDKPRSAPPRQTAMSECGTCRWDGTIGDGAPCTECGTSNDRWEPQEPDCYYAANPKKNSAATPEKKCETCYHDVEGRRHPCAGCTEYSMWGPMDDPAAATPQPPPKSATGPDIQDLVIRDMLDRKMMGVAKYGTALRAGNGRDALWDAYQEALDLCAYLRQAIAERDG